MTKVTNWLSYQPRASVHEPAVLQIFDQIGEDWFGGSGISAKAFSDALQSVGPGPLVVEINSPGGNVWDGLAIYNMLRGRQSPVTTRVVGIAASIASIIALAGDTIEMADASLFMIHDPSGMVAGTSEDMRKMANALDQHAEILAGIYVKRTGKTSAQIRAAMTAETWFTAQEAIQFGLADKSTEQLAMAACWHPRAVSPKAPQAVRDAINKGISQFNAGYGADVITGETISKVQPIANGEIPDDDLVAEIVDWWGDNEAFLDAPENSTKNVETNLYGGAAGRDWFRALYIQTQQTEEPSDKLSTASTPAAADGATTAPTSQQTPHNMTESNPVVAAASSAPTALDIESIVAKAVAAAISAKAITAAPAPEPVAPVRIENLGNSLLEKHKSLRAGAERNRFLVSNHSELLRQSRLIAPQNANTFASGLVVDYLADAVITVATSKLAMVSNFTRAVGLDNLRPRATVQVKKFTGGDDAQDNLTDFENNSNNESTLAATSVTVNQITKTFTVTQQELNQGFSLSDLSQGSAEIFALAISKKITAVMTAANYGTPASGAGIIGTAANFDTSDLPQILALAKNYRNKLLLLDGGHMARLQFAGTLTAAAGTNPFPDIRYGPLNNGFFGFNNILEQNDWTGAIANTVGFVCGQDAIAVASGLPVGMIAGEFIEQRTVELSNGLSVLLSVWYSRASRAHMASYDIMFGAAAADTTQAEVLITA